MSTFASLAGISIRFAQFSGPRETRRGEDVRTFDNTLVAGSDRPRRQWEGTTVPLSHADVNALRYATESGPVVFTGEKTRGAEVLCHVRITSLRDGPDVQGGITKRKEYNETLTVSLTEVL